MSEAEDIGAYGCLAVLGLMACGVFYSVYALYDGYYSRELPADQTALIEAKAHISTSANKRLLDITLENNSEWIITEISTKISVSLEDGSSRNYVRKANAKPYYGNSADLEITPQNTGYCVAPLPEALDGYFSKGQVKKWTWNAVFVGHRRPIRLVKIPAQYLMNLWPKVKGLFERE